MIYRTKYCLLQSAEWPVSLQFGILLGAHHFNPVGNLNRLTPSLYFAAKQVVNVW